MKLPLALLCGGLGTRMSPLTDQKPKSLIEVCGKPFIEHQLNLLRSSGFNKIIICAGHFGSQIAEFVGNGSKWGMNIQYSFDGDGQVGTGAAVLNALELLGNSFFIMYGDSYLPIDYSSMQNLFDENNYSAVMAVFKNQNRHDTSNAMFIGDSALVRYSKNSPNSEMEYIDYGVSILDGRAFDPYKSIKEFDLSKVFEDISEKRQLLGFEVYSKFYEIGSFQGLSDLNKYFEGIDSELFKKTS